VVNPDNNKAEVGLRNPGQEIGGTPKSMRLSANAAAQEEQRDQAAADQS